MERLCLAGKLFAQVAVRGGRVAPSTQVAVRGGRACASTYPQQSDDIVVGAGVIGVCTAYSLAKQGRKVTVLERRGAPGEGTSYINGTLICPSLMLPWAGPQMIPKLFRSFLDKQHPLKVHPEAIMDPDLWRFGLHYLACCRPGQTQVNTGRLARLASYSRSCLDQLLQEDPGLSRLMDQTARGTLQVFDSSEAMQRCLDASALIRDAGVPLTVLSPEECDAVDPVVVRALREQGKYAVYIFSALDTNGDCHKLTKRLASTCEQLGVRFEYEMQVVGFEKTSQEGWSVRIADNSCVRGENIVLCAGIESPKLASRLGLYLPMYPVKGYAITVPLKPGVVQLTGNVVQDSKKLYLAPLGSKHIRITGCAEFSRSEAEVDMQRASILTKQAAALLPGMLDLAGATYHAGLRPLSADDVPILGCAGHGVYLNTGHGSKGWTHAFGSGQLLADLIAEERQPALDLRPYDLARFWPLRAALGPRCGLSAGPARVSLPLPIVAQ